MNALTSELLREAVGYADGWWFCQDGRLTNGHITWKRIEDEPLKPYAIAALASQLISQVDATDKYDVVTFQIATRIFCEGQFMLERAGNNRDENSIIACVEFFRGQR